jgi:hypothetical protein
MNAGRPATHDNSHRISGNPTGLPVFVASQSLLSTLWRRCQGQNPNGSSQERVILAPSFDLLRPHIISELLPADSVGCCRARRAYEFSGRRARPGETIGYQHRRAAASLAWILAALPKNEG